jgi:hypothetical protein
VARLAFRVAPLAALVAVGCWWGVADAQTLARLHVHAFTLSADQTNVNVGQAFHLSLEVHLDERVAEIDNVQLPSLTGFEDLGDERRCTIAPIGTDCVETLTVDALAPGDRKIGPALIEFVDGATGRERTLESNVITVHVTGTAVANPDAGETIDGDNPLADLLWTGLRLLLVLALVAIALWALLWGYRRRPAPVPAPQPVPPPAPPRAETPWEQRMRELGAELAAEPTRQRAVAVRADLRAHIGAGERETLADLTRRDAAAGDAHFMAALAAVERAAFCEDASVAEAAREAGSYLMQ